MVPGRLRHGHRYAALSRTFPAPGNQFKPGDQFDGQIVVPVSRRTTVPRKVLTHRNPAAHGRGVVASHRPRRTEIHELMRPCLNLAMARLSALLVTVISATAVGQ